MKKLGFLAVAALLLGTGLARAQISQDGSAAASPASHAAPKSGNAAIQGSNGGANGGANGGMAQGAGGFHNGPLGNPNAMAGRGDAGRFHGNGKPGDPNARVKPKAGGFDSNGPAGNPNDMTGK